mmetsp:Transcript_17064/g.31389  ORF Transcript_17064/g.31389 Transcript_17064/m.31389 type:complete len:471 (-) Transcript_17064:89-1501(-)
MVSVQVWDEQYGQIYTGPVILVWAACWSIVWALMHPIIHEIWNTMEEEAAKDAKGKRVKLKAYIQRKEKSPRESPHPNLSHLPSVIAQQPDFQPSKSTDADDLFLKDICHSRATRPELFRSPTAATRSRSPGSFFKEFVSRPKSTVTPPQDRLPNHIRAIGRTKKGWLEYTHKLQRELIYYLCAAIAGLTLSAVAVFQDDPVQDLLIHFSSVRQVMFAGAMGHWFVNIFEDIRCWKFASTGLNVSESPSWCCRCVRNWNALAVNLAHHVVMLVIYGVILGTSRLGGLGVQTLVSELPMVFLNRRMLAYAKDVPPMWMCDPTKVKAHWGITMAMFVLARLPLFGLWLYSLLPGRGADILREHLDPTQKQVFVVLIAMLTVMNLFTAWLLTYLFVIDVTRAAVWSLSEFEGFQDIQALPYPTASSEANEFEKLGARQTCKSDASGESRYTKALSRFTCKSSTESRFTKAYSR